MSEISGETLIGWGFKPGRWFKGAIEAANAMRQEGRADPDILDMLRTHVPVEQRLRSESLPFAMFLEPETDLERQNAAAVSAHMEALLRVPTLVAGAVMPDACPSGVEIGTIPVGGAVAAKNAIHPGFHSSDVCCSVAMTVFAQDDDPKRLLDAVQAVTHFGPGGRRPDVVTAAEAPLLGQMRANPFLNGLENQAIHHFATQGDGNHFAYVGHRRSDGALALVTHHGSRGLGAQLYIRGMGAAKRHTRIHAPGVSERNAWIVADSQEGQDYWEALQLVRAWTKASHFRIHQLAALKSGNGVREQIWNEHNFVFQKSDGLFYHGKGATPSWSGFAADDSGFTLIPLNMSEPILIATHRDHEDSLGFAPHGAGRNASRTQHLRGAAPGALDDELAGLAARGLDIRSYCGVPDLSELPSAYKNAAALRQQIAKYRLADIVDQIDPYGCIMAGDIERDAPWRKKRDAKRAAKAAQADV